MITIPAEALFDILRGEESAKFRLDRPGFTYMDYYMFISDSNFLYKGYEHVGTHHINITKAGFMELLLNRVFVCDEYELKIEL